MHDKDREYKPAAKDKVSEKKTNVITNLNKLTQLKGQSTS